MIRPCLDESPRRGNPGVGRSGVLEQPRRPENQNILKRTPKSIIQEYDRMDYLEEFPVLIIDDELHSDT
ncbi:MAG: hypothetical protein PHE39_10365, partial [Methanoculleus bourgensis]|nr:hypothetical protein [Methanoculleus bourgensis]